MIIYLKVIPYIERAIHATQVVIFKKFLSCALFRGIR